MTSPIGGGSEHTSRYRAIGEFDNLIKAAREARRELKQLREEEAKLNAQSLSDDQKIIASKQKRSQAEQQSAKAAKASLDDLNKTDTAGKAGQDAGTQYARGIGKGVQQESSASNRQWLNAATKALGNAFAEAGTDTGTRFARKVEEGVRKEIDANSTVNAFEKTVKALQKKFDKAGEESGTQFLVGVRQRFRRDSEGVLKDSGFEYSLRQFADRAARFGQNTGFRYVLGISTEMKQLNDTLSLLGLDKLDIDVDIDDARQAIDALEFELTDLSHQTTSPQVRIDTNRALVNLRQIQKVFRDEVAEDIVKDSERIRKELEKLDKLPSGKAFKFWALNAMSDMARVFEEAEEGATTFEKLRLAASGGGGGGNFLRTFVSGFDDFSESSSQLLQRLGRVSGELYRMPGLIAVLVSSIPALVSGLGAIGGGALGLASGLGAALGAVAAFPSAGLALITTVGTLSSTFGGFAEILKNAQQARADELEAQEMQRLGTEKALTAQQKYNVALRDMSPATEAVTEAVVAFSEEWGEAQKRIGENFFEEVVDSTEDLNQLLPMTENLLSRAATAVGKVVDAGINMATSGPWKKDFQQISKDNAVFIENMGFAGLELADAFKDIAIAAGPFNTWLTASIREGAAAFSDWAKQARGDGTIQTFLGETQESLQSLWQIFKNLGNVVNSFFQSTVDEGQRYLRTLEDITGHWADVAEAQEAANSPLRQWMTQIRPVLTALGDLIADVARGIAGLASNQNSITMMISLLNSLRTDVLPPILSILQQLNDSGIAVTVVQALGGLLEAISTFLESGAATALSVFVTVLANFAELLFNIASLPGISDVLGAVASGLAAIAAVSIVARFTGLFKLWDFFTWMTRNRGNLTGAFADAARGAAGLATTGQTQLPASIPSAIGGIGSEVTGGANAERQITRTGDAAQAAATKTGMFSRALQGVRGAGSAMVSGLTAAVGFLGGPWTAAILGAVAVIGVIANDLSNQKKSAEDTKNAWLALADAYGQLQQGETSTTDSLARTDEKFRGIAETAKQYGITLTDLSGALNNNEQASTRVNDVLDRQAAALKEQYMNGEISHGVYMTLNNSLNAYRRQIEETANAQRTTNDVTNDNIALSRTYKERLGGLTQAQVDNAVAAKGFENTARTLSNALDTLSSSTASAEDRSKALSDIIRIETDDMVRANEATENWNTRILDLRDALETNGNTLSKHTREGLRNRDALQAAATATRELYLQDIAAGVPMDKATERHRKRTEQLIKEAGKNKETRSEAKLLVDMYGKIPEDVQTKFGTTGYAKVYEDLQKALFMQTALQKGISVDAASGIINKDLAEARRGSGGRGDGYGIQKFATGGPVWGAGTRTSDSIRAWLSNGEFVQPTDAVEHYGMPIMEAIRTRKLDREVIAEALPDSGRTAFSSGGHAHSNNCVSCASGGHKFARGGSVTWPMPVNVSKTKVDKGWINQGGALGTGGGGAGWQWQMRVLRQAFPGLELWSGYRPGSRTLSGNQSYHSLGRAVDIAPRRDVAAWIRANYGARTKELITPYNDLNLHNGKPHRYTGAVWNQHNFAGGNAHNHWAFNKGGLVDLMGMLNMNNITPSQNTSLPTTPRSLSPAASSVVNNSTENTRTFGDVIINNPAPERAGDSVRDALYRTTLLY